MKSQLLGLRDIAGIVHRDIKPDNILLIGEEGGKSTVKIADLGLGIRVKDQKRKRKRGGHRGTSIYMAPESNLYGEYGYSVDILALGCYVLEMIAQRHVSDHERNCVYLGDNLHRVIDLPVGLSKDAEDFLKKTWKRKPKSRWSDKQLLLLPFVDIED